MGVLLFLMWAPALNLLSRAKASRVCCRVIFSGCAALSRRDFFGRLIRLHQRQTSLISSLGVLSGPQLNQRTKRTSISVQVTITPRIYSRTPMIATVRFIGKQTGLFILAFWPWPRHHQAF